MHSETNNQGAEEKVLRFGIMFSNGVHENGMGVTQRTRFGVEMGSRVEGMQVVSNAPGTFQASMSHVQYGLGVHMDQKVCNTFEGCHNTFDTTFEWDEEIENETVAGFQCEGGQHS